MNTSTIGLREFVINNQRYSQVDIIGEGGQGAVYKVINLLTGKEYALKIVFRTRYQELNKLIDQQISIMRKLNQLKCPSIIKLVDEQITSDCNMIVMELGEYSLSSYKEIFQTTLTDMETITLIKDILLALKTVHKINIIHRDIKPQNIIVNTSDSKHPYKLTDFGVSAGNSARKCTFIGTEPYMAPEVIHSKSQDNFYSEIADIWSFALVVFEAFFGFNPFVLTKNTRIQVQLNLINELSSNGFKWKSLLVVLKESKLDDLSADFVKKYNEAPREILSFLERGLHKNPEKRIKLSQVEKIFQNPNYVPAPLLTKEQMKTNITRARGSIINTVPPTPTNVAKSSNIGIEPLKKAPSINKSVGVMPQTNKTIDKTVTPMPWDINSNTTETIMPNHTPYVFSSTYKVDDMSSSNYSAEQSVGKTSTQNSMMKPIIKRQSTRMEPQTQGPIQSMTRVQTGFSNHNKNNQGVWNTFGGTPSKIINNQLSRFIEDIRKKLGNLWHAIKDLQNSQFSELLMRIDKYLNSHQYDQVAECKEAVSGAYYHLYRLLDENNKFLQDKKMTRQYTIQFLYELIILANLSQITKNPASAMRGMPQSLVRLSNDPNNYLTYFCNYDMLKQFEWRFFSSVPMNIS